MRWTAMALIVLLAASRAGAECREAPPPDTSADRSIGDVPYAPSEPRTAPCPPPAAATDPTREPWTADVDDDKRAMARAGMFGVAFGALLLFTGASFAVCAHQPLNGQSAAFCKAGEAPLLIAGGASTLLGLGGMAVATWVMKDDAGAPGRRPTLEAGLTLRLPLDLVRR